MTSNGAETSSLTTHPFGEAQLGPTRGHDPARFFTLSLDLLCIAGADGYFQLLNPAWERVLGYPLEELYAQPFVSFVHPDDYEATLTEAAKLGQGVHSVSFENRYRCSDGSYKWLLWTSTAVPEANAIYAIARDITERKQAEAEARTQAQLFSLILDQMADGVIVADPQGNVLVYNKVAEQLFGKGATDSREDDRFQQYGLFQSDQVTPLPPDALPLARTLRGERIDDVEMFVRHEQEPAGRWTSVTGRPLVGVEGQLHGGVIVCRDVTEQKAATEQAQRLAAILENTADFVGIGTLEGHATYINRAGRAMIGLASDAPLTGHLISANHPDWAMKLIGEQGIPTALQQGVWVGETALLSPAGREIPISQVIVAHKNAAGEVLYLSTIGRDLTAQKQAETERLRLQEEVIHAQGVALRELSTPLIPIADGVVVMPLIGSLDSARALQVIDALLNGVSERRARIAILDITGVSVVDTQVANGIIRAAQAVKLLGALVLLTGIRPEVAQTLVQLGVDLSGIVTRGSLQDGIGYALQATTQR